MRRRTVELSNTGEQVITGARIQACITRANHMTKSHDSVTLN